MLAGFLMLAAAWFVQPGQSFDFLQRCVPDAVISMLGALVPRHRAYLLRAYALAVAIALAFLLVFGLLGGWLLAGRMIAPLTPITDATRKAANGCFLTESNSRAAPTSSVEPADAFDTILARLEAHIAEQRRFSANPSHELRTPLAITQTLLDVARNDPNRDTGELVDRLHVINARAIDLTGALLLLSRADQRSFTREPRNLDAQERLLPCAALDLNDANDAGPLDQNPRHPPESQDTTLSLSPA